MIVAGHEETSKGDHCLRVLAMAKVAPSTALLSPSQKHLIVNYRS